MTKIARRPVEGGDPPKHGGTGRWLARASLVALALGWGAPLTAADSPAVTVAVNAFALVPDAPVRNGYSPFSIEAFALLPAARQRESFSPGEDEAVYPLRRTVERVLQRKEIPRGWSRSNEGKLAFSQELGRFPGADGVAYALESELVVHGDSDFPLGVRLQSRPAIGVSLRFAVGLGVADQVVMVEDGVLDEAHPDANWLLRVYPTGGDAAMPVRAAVAVRALGGSAEQRQAALAGVTSALVASTDGWAAMAMREKSASEWLKPLPVFIHPPDAAAEAADKDEKAAKKGKSKGEGH